MNPDPDHPPQDQDGDTLLARALGVFQRCLELDDAERSQFVEQECQGVPGLQDCVQDLLDRHDEDDGAFATSGLAEAAHSSPGMTNSGSAPLAPDARLGNYRLLERAGAGGMGVVYRAEQDHPKRIVALKVLRLEHDSEEIRRRFSREVRLLAQLQHPSIAQIYDAGVFETQWGSMPYFAMEHVPGEAIDDCVRRRALSVEQVCSLVIDISEAVHHAHTAGIVHRDLKPGNVLVSEGADGQLQPKVLDFGIARSIQEDADDTQAATMHTATGQLLGTLGYMSPEAISSARDADHRADIYSLGVLLFELLTDKLPFDLRGLSVAEAVHVVTREDPTRLSRHDTSLRGDLEIIVAKAMMAEADRRYPSAKAFAADIRNFLENRPIAARAVSTWYYVRKTIRRHSTLFLGIAASLLVLLVGLIASLALAYDNEVLAAKERTQREEAVRTRDQLDATLYRSDMRFVASAVDDLRRREQARALIERRRATLASDRPDPRGFEWYLADAMVHTARLVVDGARDTEMHWSDKGIRYTGSSEEIHLDPQTGVVERRKNPWVDHPWSRRTAADGKRFVSKGPRGGVVIANHGEPEPLIEIPFVNANDTRISPDGRYIAIAGINNDIEGAHVFDTETREFVGDPAPNGIGNRCFEFSPDSRWLAESGNKPGLRIWDVTTMRNPREIDLFRKGREFSLDWTHDGKRIAIGTRDGEILIIDVVRGTVEQTLQGHTDQVSSVKWNSQGARLASCGLDSTVRIWDLETGENRIVGCHYGWVWRIAWSPDDTQVASNGYDLKLRIFDITRQNAIHRLRPPQPRCWDARWLFADDLLAVDFGEWTGMVSADTGEILRRFEGQDIRLSTSGLWLCGRDQGQFFIQEVATGQIVLRRPEWTHGPVAWHPVEDQLAVADNLSGIWVWQPDNSASRLPADVPFHYRTAAGHHLEHAAALFGASSILWHLDRGGDVLTGLRHNRYGYRISRSSGGWNRSTWNLPLSGAGSYMRSPDGSAYAFTNRLQEFLVYDLHNGNALGKLVGHRTDPTGATWSPDTKRIASWTRTDKLRLWDAAMLEEVFSLRMPGQIAQASWSRDSQRLAIVAGGALYIADGSRNR